MSFTLLFLLSQATGTVFHDQNANGVHDPSEPGLPGVAVSNGREVVLTDDDGRYTLALTDDTILFVIKPSDWQVPLAPGTGLPLHYRVHKPAGSPPSQYGGLPPTPLTSADFPLHAAPEPRAFDVVAFGDTQPRDLTELDYISHDVLEELIGTPAAFGITLGDLVFDDLSVLEPLTRSIGLLGIPWHHVIGNHDLNYDAPTSATSDETYERIFGPSSYAFDYGDVHFIVLNDVVWDVENRSYYAAVPEPRRTFIENDLRHVPTDRLVVVLMHIPLPDMADLSPFFHLLRNHPHNLSLSSHWHTQSHFLLDTTLAPAPHHHIVLGTSCGAWWSGRPDERGIPHTTMQDGTPNGYSILSFTGTDYTIRYQAAGRPPDYQMTVHTPDPIPASSRAEVTVNFFTGSSLSHLTLSVDGSPPVPMERFDGPAPGISRLRQAQDDFVARIARERNQPVTDELTRQILSEYQSNLGRSVPFPAKTDHLWRSSLPPLSPGHHLLRIQATDHFGRPHTAHRILRVAPPSR